MSIEQSTKYCTDDEHCFQLPNKLKEYIGFYLTYNTEKRSEQDLLRLSAKNRYFTKNDRGYLAHKRCIINYVWPQLDDRQFDEITRKIASRMDDLTKIDDGKDAGFGKVDAQQKPITMINQYQKNANLLGSKASSGFSRRPTFASQSILMPYRPSCSVVSGLVPAPPAKPRTRHVEPIRPQQQPRESTLKNPTMMMMMMTTSKLRIAENDEANYCNATYNVVQDDGLDDEVVHCPPPKPIFEKEDSATEVPKMEISADIEFECEICHVISPSEFYIRPYPSIVHDIRDELTSMMNNVEFNSCPMKKFGAGMYCTKQIDGIYRRFKILRTSVDKTGNDFLILIDIDSGVRIWCGTRGLCPLPLQFRYFQQQAIACRLYGLAPSPSDDQTPKWPESVVNHFKQFCNLTLQSNVLNVCDKVTEDGCFTVSMYKNVQDGKIWAHEYLLSQNFQSDEEKLITVEEAPAKFYNF